MKQIPIILLLSFWITSCTSGIPGNTNEKRLLIFSKTSGFRHSSIPVAKSALMKLATENGFNSDTTETTEMFTLDQLNEFDAVIFLLTSGDVLNESEQNAFEGYIQNGGGYIGVHSASDTEYEWEWYGKLVGGYFESHPKPQEASIQVIIKDHPATAHLPIKWIRKDEWYNFKQLNPDVTVLANLDETSYEGGKLGEHHPIAWFQEYDGGKMFFTALGHTEESYTEENFLKHIWGGIEYVTTN